LSRIRKSTLTYAVTEVSGVTVTLLAEHKRLEPVKHPGRL
jgi:hypothetical protein